MNPIWKKGYFFYLLVAGLMVIASTRFLLEGTSLWFIFPNFVGPLTEEIVKLLYVYLLLFLWAEYKKDYDVNLSKIGIAVFIVGISFGIWEAYTTYFGEHIYRTIIRSASHLLYVYIGFIAFRTQESIRKGLVVGAIVATAAHSIFNALSSTNILYQALWLLVLVSIATTVRYSRFCREKWRFKLPLYKE